MTRRGSRSGCGRPEETKPLHFVHVRREYVSVAPRGFEREVALFRASSAPTTSRTFALPFAVEASHLSLRVPASSDRTLRQERFELRLLVGGQRAIEG